MPRHPEDFLRVGERVIASFSFTDIASGTGGIIFYPTATRTSTTITYALVSNVVTSEPVATGTTPPTTLAKIKDIDFDVLFTKVQRVKGRIIVNIPITSVRGSRATVSTYAKVTLIRVSGGTPSTFGALQQTPTITNTTANPITRTMALGFDVTTIEHFKRDDLLRVNVELWAETTSAGSSGGSFSGFFHDPKGSTTSGNLESGESSTMEVHVPLVLDL